MSTFDFSMNNGNDPSIIPKQVAEKLYHDVLCKNGVSDCYGE